MGYDLFGVIFFSLLTPVVILGFIAFWALTSRERQHVEDTWEVFATRRQREYFPARGDWPNRTSPGVRWTRNHVVYELTVLGVEAGARTRLSARPRERLLGGFAIRAGAKLALTENPPGVSDRAFDDTTRRALLGFRQHEDVALSYRRGRVMLEWPGRECNEARIDEAESVVAALVTGIESAFHDAGRKMAS